MRILRSTTILLMLGASSLIVSPGANAQVSIGVSVHIAPPALPVYVQPPLPGPGYIWTPGYWAWNGAGYYWVPGTWVLPPRVGVLWTPGYWGWNNGLYAYNAGYWGPHVGFYGGISYGFGYTGVGFGGGYWNNGAFSYNSSVTNVSNTNVTNVYNKTVVNNTTKNVSFNGGKGGVDAKPTPEELAAAKEPHVAPTAEQTKHQEAASKNPSLSYAKNHGHPAVAATSHPGVFKGAGVVSGNGSKTEAGETPHKETMEKKAGGPPSASGPKPNAEKPTVAPKEHASSPVQRRPTPHVATPRRPPPPHPGKRAPH